MRTLAVVVALAVLAGGCSRKRAARTVRVAAASDLTKAFTELGKELATTTGITPELNFGSSGLLAKQIEQGAPFFLFAAANKSFVDQVVASGRCDAKTVRLYARGRIVVWTAPGKPAPASLADLARPEFKRIAIANPEHAPYGVAAQQALRKTGVWERIADRVVMGDNVSATLLYAKNGDADAAIVALSLAIATDGGTALKIDPALHDPLDQALVVCGTGEEAALAQQFADYIASHDGRETMTRYGFVLPDAATP